MIEMHGLTKAYRTSDIETTALDNINIEINTGEFIAIMGPSGCGKSTLLNIMGMLDSPDSGSYLFLGEDVAGYGESKLADIRKHNIGFIFQSFNLVDELTVAENVMLPLLYQKVPAAERDQRVQTVLERVGIAHRAGHRPQQLSGGQQQRVAVDGRRPVQLGRRNPSTIEVESGLVAGDQVIISSYANFIEVDRLLIDQ